jgi:hypothetical protein
MLRVDHYATGRRWRDRPLTPAEYPSVPVAPGQPEGRAEDADGAVREQAGAATCAPMIKAGRFLPMVDPRHHEDTGVEQPRRVRRRREAQT